MTPDQFTELKTQTQKKQAELTEIAKEFDKNMEDKTKRKELEDKFKSLTLEYNQLVLQAVKETQKQEVGVVE